MPSLSRCSECLGSELAQVLGDELQAISDVRSQRAELPPTDERISYLDSLIFQALTRADKLHDSVVMATNGCSHCPLVDKRPQA